MCIFDINVACIFFLDFPRRGRGRGATNIPEVLKFDGEYDFEQANAEFQELESKLAKNKIGTLMFKIF